MLEIKSGKFIVANFLIRWFSILHAFVLNLSNHFLPIKLINLLLIVGLFTSSCTSGRQTERGTTFIESSNTQTEGSQENHLSTELGSAPVVEEGQIASDSLGIEPLPLMFIENVGQFDPKALFQVQAGNTTLFIAQNEIWFTYYEKNKRQDFATLSPIEKHSPERILQAKSGVNLRFSFPGSNPNVHVEPIGALNSDISYLVGNNPSNWKKNIPVWSGVRYVDLYPGADLELTSENGSFVWNLIIKDETIFYSSENMPMKRGLHLQVNGQKKLVLENGGIDIETDLGNFFLPLINIVGGEKFNMGRMAPKILDDQIQLFPPLRELNTETNTGSGVLPVLTRLSGWTMSMPSENPVSSELLYVQILGDGSSEGIAVDDDGFIYVAGSTDGNNFPTTPGAFDYMGGGDVFVSKIDPTTNTLIYSTFIGGTGWDSASAGLLLGADKSVFVAGVTTSDNFPVVNEYLSMPTGNSWKSFLMKISPAGNSILYSSYLQTGMPYAMDMDSSENIHVLIGSSDKVIVKIKTDGTPPFYVLSLDLSNIEHAYDLTVGSEGKTYVTGQSNSQVFVKGFDAQGNPLLDISFGGMIGEDGHGDLSQVDGWDFGEAIYVDQDGYIYVAGGTYATTDFPTTDGALRSGSNGDPMQADAFITKLTPAGAIEYSTLLGGNGIDFISSIVTSNTRDVYVTGETEGDGFLSASGLKQDPINDDCGACSAYDVFAIRLNLRSDAINYDVAYETYIGGNSDDYNAYGSEGILVDGTDNIYITGSTGSPDFFGVPNMDWSVFIVKISTNAPPHVFDPQVDVYPESVAISGGNMSSSGGSIESDNAISTAACSQETCGDPVNVRTGVFSFSLSDLSFPTNAGDLIFQRSYSSGTSTESSFGFGWTQNHDARLILPTNPEGVAGYVIFQSPLGNRYLFEIESNGDFTPGPGVIASLTQSTTGYMLTTSQNTVFNFDLNGLLTSRQDANGNLFTYVYDLQGRLDRITSGNGLRFFELNYDVQGRIVSVIDHAEREVLYGYDINGNLISFTDVLGAEWTYEYDASHRMTKMVDPDLNIVVTNQYDPLGRITSQYDGVGGLLVAITYNSDGSTSVMDALGNEQLYESDLRGVITDTTDAFGDSETRISDHNFRPTTIENAAGHALNMTWSADGLNLLDKTDPANHTTSYTYDALNNLTSTTDPLGNTTTYTYIGNLLTISTDALGAETTYTYTPEGYLESATDPLGRTTSYTYDGHGQRLSMTDPNGHTWTYAYDAIGRMVHTTDPRGRVMFNEYNAAGQLLRTTQNYDPNRLQNDQNLYNLVTEYGYDARGNQVTVTDTLGRLTQYVYDDANRLIQTVDPIGNTTTNTYDPAGRLISTTSALDHTTTYVYDANGRLISTINPLGESQSGAATFDVPTNTSTVTTLAGATTFHYDELGRVIQVVDAMGSSTYTTYDPNGNVATRTDPLGRVTTYEYDELNRLVKTIDPNGGITQTVYNAQGQRIATIDALGDTTTYTYDAQGRLTATTDPLGRVTQTEYDQYGRRAASIDALGNRTEYTYDLLDRVIAVEDALGNTTRTTYNALGNVISRADANGNVTTYTYDNLNRTATVTDPNGNTTTNAYDAAGNLTTVTNALGETTTYTHDALNRQVAVTDALGNTTQTIYNSLGQVSSTIDANGVVTYFVYDALGRQAAVVLNYKPTFQPDAETNVRYEYEYNAAGNRILVREPKGSVTTFTYDALNRVTGKTDPLGNTWSYTYDLAGNQVSMTDGKGQTTNYVYDDAGQLTTIDYPAPEADISFTYNLNGQRITMTDGLGTTTWNYDALNRLVSVQDAQNASIGYGYDAAGNRTSLTYPNNATVSYQYDDANQLTAVMDWDNQSTGYAYDPAGRLVSVARPNGVDSSYTYDDAGRLVQLQHEAGASSLAAYSYTYDPVGNLMQAAESVLRAENEYALTVDIVGQGSVIRSSDGPYHLNDVVLLTAVADPGWTFTGWSECSGTDPCSVTMTGDKTVTATFTQDEYTLEVVSEHGTVTKSPEQTTYHYGDVVQLEAVPDADWEFTGWSGGASGMDNPISVTIQGNTSITASYGETNPSSGLIFADGFESGNFSVWDWADTDGGDLSVSTQAAAIGTYGMQAVIDDTNTIKLYETLPGAEKHFNSRFYLNPNSVNISSGGGVNIFAGYSSGWAFCLYLEKMGTDYRLYSCGIDDTGAWVEGKPVYIQDQWQAIEMEWMAASAEGANDGYLRLYVNDILVSQIDNLDTDTQSITKVSFGVSDIPSDTTGTLYFDGFESRSGNHIGLDPNGPQLPVPLTDLIFRDGFESADTTTWDSVNTGGGNLSVTSTAAAIGGYGLQATVSGTTSMYVTDYSPLGEKQYHARFYFNPYNFNLTTEDRVVFFSAYGFNKTAFTVSLRYSGGTYWIRQEYQLDDLTYARGVYHPIAPDWQALEFDWRAASASGANDGSLSMSINGVLVETLGGIDNDTMTVESAYMGLVSSLDPGMSGTLYFDGFVSQSAGTIGLDPNGPSLSDPITPPDLAFSDDFESGDLSKWSGASTNSGNLGVSTDAADQGIYGLKVNISSTSSMYARYYPPILEDEYHAQFRFHPNSLSLANGKAHYIYDGMHYVTGSRLIRLEILSENSEHKLRVQVRRDDGTYASTGKYVISNDWHTIQVGWKAASADGSHDGMAELWIDDVLMESLTGVDNDLLLLNELRFGAPSGLDTGTIGAMLFDDFTTHRSALTVESAAVTETSTPLPEEEGTATPAPEETGTPTPIGALPGYANISLNLPALPRFLSDVPMPDVAYLTLDTLTITYDYDALRRLTSAAYSDGRSFSYIYDPNGNALEYSDQGAVTNYQYDAANQLLTAEKGQSLWHYAYDANGSLVEVLPNNTENNGAKRYTYNAAGYLTQVEAHNGAGWDVQAEMVYNGLGQRLSMDAAGVIAYYVMDGNRPLTAESDGNTTSYLYGLGVIAEETSEWNYALPDGGNTPRQLTDMQGEVTLSIRYTPWGGVLETHGTGNFSFGYLGGVLDAATNLIYVGNGQYYDPSTGRFLTRNVNPNSPNPYVPFDPTGLLLGPLGLLAVFYSGRRNKKSAPYVVLLIVLVVLPMSVSLACRIGNPAPAPAPTEQPLATETPTPGGATDGGDAPSTLGAPSPQPTDPCDDPIPPTVSGKPTIVVFGGSGGDPSTQGPDVPGSHMTAWKQQYLSEYKVLYQQYQSGGKAATARFAANRDDLRQENNVSLVCYSGGSEACLMYADLRRQQGLTTESIILLGGGYYSRNLSGDLVGFDYWGGQINNRLNEGTRILVINDNQNDSSSADPNAGFTPTNSRYAYHTVGIDHYVVPQSDGTFWRPSDDLTDLIVDKSSTMRDAILQWIKTGCWPLPENWSPN
jgi:uncharacterized repeat protein (TIGR02543 family)